MYNVTSRTVCALCCVSYAGEFAIIIYLSD